MSKRNKIIYWIATLWLCLGTISSGIVQLFQVNSEVAFILEMGYPSYFIPLLGFWKILAVVALLIPRFALIKEWAYAGIFFAMSGALYSHLALGHPAGEIFPPVLLLVLTFLSWYFRPESRKVSWAKAATHN